MRNKPHPERWCKRKIRRRARNPYRYARPAAVDAACEAFGQFLEDFARRHTNVRLVRFPEPQSGDSK